MSRIKGMTLRDMEKNVKTWQKLRKFYLMMSIFLITALAGSFIYRGIELDFFDIVISMLSISMIYFPVLIELSIRNRINREIERQLKEIYREKRHTNSV